MPNRIHLRFILNLVVTILALSVQGCSLSQKSPSKPSPIKAVVLVVVDQLSASAFSEYEVGEGFQTLTKRSAFFPIARFPHLHPETCPGHATISTGTYPWKHGIVENWWKENSPPGDRYCAFDKQHKISPQALKRPSLGELLKQRGFDVRVASVSGKDRSAVMMSGKVNDLTTWYNKEDGSFTTSSFFRGLPETIREFNSKEPWKDYFLSPWHVTPELSLPYGFSLEPDLDFFQAVGSGPAVDDLSFEVFSRLIGTLNDESPQALHVLALSLSALDHVGHRYGAGSPYYQSALRNVDRLLPRLLALLDATYGEGGYVLALTGDHGVFPIEKEGVRRVSSAEIHCARKGTPCGGGRERLCYDNLDPSSRWYQHARFSFFPGRGENCVQIYDEDLLPYGGGGTAHVTPYPHDTDVPLWFLGLPPGVHQKIVSPAAIVPTVMDLLGEGDLESEDFDEKSIKPLAAAR